MAEEQGLTHTADPVRHEAHAHDVKVLGRLLAAAQDSETRFEQAAQDAESDGRRRLFESLCEERGRMVRDLRATVVALGGPADGDGGSILTKARRAMTDIGHALLGDETHAADVADDGEQALARRLDEALADPELSDMARAAVRRARAMLGEDREDLHALRLSLDSRRDAASPLFPA